MRNWCPFGKDSGWISGSYRFGSVIAADQSVRDCRQLCQQFPDSIQRGVSWLECLSTPSNSPASPWDLYQDDPDNGDERGRLSFTLCSCFGDVQPWLKPAPHHPSVSLGCTGLGDFMLKEERTPRKSCGTALPLPGPSKQRPRGPRAWAVPSSLQWCMGPSSPPCPFPPAHGQQ